MVSRVLVDAESELVALTHRFVCLKFCEADDKGEYYRAAGVLLPQWYWQPVFAICWPDGREINIHWRKTHVVTWPGELAEILTAALAITGDGLAPEVVRTHRKLLSEGTEALVVEEFDEAIRCAETVKKAVPRGRVRRDAERLAREAVFLRDLAPHLARVQESDLAGEDEENLLNALNLCAARAYTEALPLLARVAASDGSAAETAGKILPGLTRTLGDAVRISRVSLGRYRVGPDIYHDIRAQVRNTVEGLGKLVMQYFVRLRDGRVYAAFEEHGPVETMEHLRSSAFLPRAEVGPAENVADIRVELWLGDRRIGVRHLREEGETRWWDKIDKVWPLRLDTGRYSTWSGLGFPKTGKAGLTRDGRVAGHKLPDDTDPVLAEIRQTYTVLDGRLRFTYAAQAARYRLCALGTPALRYLVPLAYRHGAITTLQLLPVLARNPHPDAYGRLLHNLGADDVTLKYPAFRQLGWLRGQDAVPTEELRGYLVSSDARLAELAARAAGIVGKKDCFLPVLDYLREQEPGSKGARYAVKAIRTIAGQDFGLDPEKPLSAQSSSVKRIHAWWRGGAEKNPRAVWMAGLLEEMGFAGSGELVRAVKNREGDALLPALRGALRSGSDAARAYGLVIGKHLKLKELGPEVFRLFNTMNLRDDNLDLARNTLRDLMNKELLGELVELLTVPGKRSVVLDLLLVITGAHDLYPGSGLRMSGDEWERQHVRWKEWLGENAEKIRWDGKEKRFVPRQ
jgi:hypothetical protein